MRLICPSCGAQYEVDESVIPDGGRDVQCSNCGHAWFQRSAKQLQTEAETAEAPVLEETAPDASEPTDEPAPEPEQDVIDETAERDDIATDVAEEVSEELPAEEDVDESAPEEEAESEPEAQAPDLPRRGLDDTIKSVLREEAERETRARVAEGSSVESQPDLGLAAAIGAAAATTGGRAAPADDDHDKHSQDHDEDALVSRASRKELLPDIEEINSTLRPTSERGDEAASIDAPETVARRRSGFRMGFTTALLVAVVALLVYVLAPTLAKMVPALEPALTSYVELVDAARVWLDDRMRSVTESLQGSSNG